MSNQQPPPPPAPPPGYGGQPYYPEQPPKKRGGCGRTALIVLAVIGGLVVIGGVIGALAGGDDDDDDGDDGGGDTATEETTTTTAATEAPATPGVAGEPDEVDDVTLDSCDNSGIDLATARGTITNDSSEPSNYLLDFSVIDAAGAVVGSGFGAVNDVQPDSSVPWEGIADVAVPEGGTCQLASVDRMAA
jgi:hypothetical protein